MIILLILTVAVLGLMGVAALKRQPRESSHEQLRFDFEGHR